MKEVVENLKRNEGTLKSALSQVRPPLVAVARRRSAPPQAQEALQMAEDRYDKLRVHAEGKIAEARAPQRTPGVPVR